ncbi:MAG: hypothetical protein LIO62_09000 [Clostridiales bacterium]|nr:hypothetical protein [Clostridiales bacterium]
MIKKINGTEYAIKELTNKWVVERIIDNEDISLSYEISKKDCKTEKELLEYINSNEIFKKRK